MTKRTSIPCDPSTQHYELALPDGSKAWFADFNYGSEVLCNALEHLTINHYQRTADRLAANGLELKANPGEFFQDYLLYSDYMVSVNDEYLMAFNTNHHPFTKGKVLSENFIIALKDGLTFAKALTYLKALAKHYNCDRVVLSTTTIRSKAIDRVIQRSGFRPTATEYTYHL